MGRFLLVVVAVCAWFADADVHTFQNVPLNGSGRVTLKTLYVDASRNPALIDISEFVCKSKFDGESFGNLVIAPVGVEVPRWLSCNADDLRNEERERGVYRSNSVKCGTNRTRHNKKKARDHAALNHSGLYAFYGAYCSRDGSPGTISVKISGGELNAHGGDWVMILVVFVVFHVVLSAFWLVHKQNSGESVECVAQDFFFASVVAILSHSFGLVLHIMPETLKEVAQFVHIGLWSLTVSSVMTAMISASGIGGSTPAGWFVTFFGCVVTFVFANGLGVHTLLLAGRASDQENVTNALWVAGSVCVFGLICVRNLACSLRTFKQQGLQQELAGCRMLAAVVAIYTGLVSLSAAFIYDVPNDACPNCSASHYSAGAFSTQVPQSFGLGATLYIFWNQFHGVSLPVHREDEEGASMGHNDYKEAGSVDEVTHLAINAVE